MTSKGKDPVWFPPASIRREYAAEGNPLPPEVLPGPDNPLGKFVLVLGMPSYLIHGTNRPAGVGMRVSHGCVRLFPENIENLFASVPVGTPVAIVNQPWLLAWHDDELLIEAHQPLVDDERDWFAMMPEILASQLQDAPNGRAAVDESRLQSVIEEGRGFPVPLLSGSPDTLATMAAATLVNNLAVLPEPVQEVVALDTTNE